MNLSLSRKQYTTLSKQIDEKHEIEWSVSEGYEDEMAFFLLELEDAVFENKGVHKFDIDLNVADALACSDYDLALVFSTHYFKMIAAMSKRGEHQQVNAALAARR